MSYYYEDEYDEFPEYNEDEFSDFSSDLIDQTTADYYKKMDALMRQMQSTLDRNTNTTKNSLKRLEEIEKEIAQMRKEHNEAMNRLNHSIQQFNNVAPYVANQAADAVKEEVTEALFEINEETANAVKQVSEGTQTVKATYDRIRQSLNTAGIAALLVLLLMFITVAVGTWWILTAVPAIQAFFGEWGWVFLVVGILIFIVLLKRK